MYGYRKYSINITKQISHSIVQEVSLKLNINMVTEGYTDPGKNISVIYNINN